MQYEPVCISYGVAHFTIQPIDQIIFQATKKAPPRSIQATLHPGQSYVDSSIFCCFPYKEMDDVRANFISFFHFFIDVGALGFHWLRV